jgi:hypothetical protein
VSLFGDANRAIGAEMFRAIGSPVITYSPAGGDDMVLTAVFEAPGTLIQLEPGVFQRTVEARLGCVVLADFADPPLAGDSVDVAGVGYRVSDVEPDGQGGATLNLRKL